MNLLTLFSRARQNLSLTPAERSLLKLLENLTLTFLVAVCTQISALATTGGLNFNQQTLLLLAGAGALSVFSALHKLSAASGDPLLSAVVGVVESEVGRHLPLHQQATPTPTPAPAVPVTTATPDPSASAI